MTLKLKAIKEERAFKGEVRAGASTGNTRTIEGYGALFNVESRLIGEFVDPENTGRYTFQIFTERIAPNAFDEVLKRGDLNVVHTVDHDRGKTIARNQAGNLQLSVDEKGLRYRVTFPVDNATDVQQNLYRNILQGIYQESSFVFALDDSDPTAQSWQRDNEGNLHRMVNKVSYLFDTSTVLDGAYPTGEAQARQRFARSLNEIAQVETPAVPEVKKEVEVPNTDDRERYEQELEILRLG